VLNEGMCFFDVLYVLVMNMFDDDFGEDDLSMMIIHGRVNMYMYI